MKYKIIGMANPDEFIKNNHIKIHPFVQVAKHHIKSAETKNGFGKYLAFPLTNVHTYKKIVDGKTIPFANITFDLSVFPWEDGNDVFIVEDKIWLEAIEGGLQWFIVKEVQDGLNVED